tara:strand:- start:17040 stop:17141 length:102 start_codon:yes stop_codon:yes gene_type:complete
MPSIVSCQLLSVVEATSPGKHGAARRHHTSGII